ncbi:hypothetical protein PI125_g2041 [Phytophthora idaei]|nr:hypothetical protein PI125_g2041 [Phytophthora idaei]KAG3168480.1 hypothetical protein PI126_g3284 [Phytophthora idaei]
MARLKHNGALMTCFEIWHRAWRNGTLLPKKARKRNIRARMPAQVPLGESGEEAYASSDDESTGVGPHSSKRLRTAESEE